MSLLATLVAVATIPPSSSAWTAYKPAVRQAVLAEHGRQVHIDSILIKDSYALVHGTGFHEVLQRSGKSWKPTCDLTRTAPTVNALESRCRVPATVAAQLALEEPANLLAARGQFNAAITAEQVAIASATGPQRENDRVRLQQLRILNQQMQLQQITREQAIQRWNQLQFSWALP